MGAHDSNFALFSRGKKGGVAGGVGNQNIHERVMHGAWGGLVDIELTGAFGPAGVF